MLPQELQDFNLKQNKTHDFVSKHSNMTAKTKNKMNFSISKEIENSNKIITCSDKNEENFKPRNSKEKNMKNLRNSFKSIKENSSSRVSNKFETDNDSDENQTQFQDKNKKTALKNEENPPNFYLALPSNLLNNMKSQNTKHIKEKPIESSPEQYEFEYILF